MLGHGNIVAALYGELTYEDSKRGGTVGSCRATPSCGIACAGLHLAQAGVLPHELTSAPLSTWRCWFFRLDYGRLRHPLCSLYPKSESAAGGGVVERGSSTADRAKDGRAIRSKRWRWSNRIPSRTRSRNSYSPAEYIVGSISAWDYMASLIHYISRPAGVTGPQHHCHRRSVLPKTCARCSPSYAQHGAMADRRR